MTWSQTFTRVGLPCNQLPRQTCFRSMVLRLKWSKPQCFSDRTGWWSWWTWLLPVHWVRTSCFFIVSHLLLTHCRVARVTFRFCIYTDSFRWRLFWWLQTSLEDPCSNDSSGCWALWVEEWVHRHGSWWWGCRWTGCNRPRLLCDSWWRDCRE